MKRALILFSASCFLLIITVLPLPIPPYLDFQVIYHADMGLLRGLPVYDHAGQVEMIAQLASVSPEQVFVLPFPYPPWVALATLPLALLPITIAARLWFGLNLLMLFASAWLLTDGWEARKRLASFVVAVFFWPVLGSLFVGQYVFPVLLGAALWSYAVRKEHAALTAAAFALLTFKPHLGALIFLAGIFYLWRRRDDFGRRALSYTLLAGSIHPGLPGRPRLALGLSALPVDLSRRFRRSILQIMRQPAGRARKPVQRPVEFGACSVVRFNYSCSADILVRSLPPDNSQRSRCYPHHLNSCNLAVQPVSPQL
jgi:nitrate reductase NapE component